jgi:signal transduction histidine kinase
LDTKLKSKRYSLLALVSLVLVTTIAVMSAVNIYDNRRYLQTDYYFHQDNYSFLSELLTFVELVKAVKIDYSGYESKSTREKIGNEQLKELDQNYKYNLQVAEDAVRANYDPDIEAARKAGNQALAAQRTAEKEKQLAQVRQDNQEEFNQQMERLAAEKEQEYEDRKNSLLMREGAIKYYIHDKKRNTVYSNLDHEPTETELQKQAIFSLQLPQNSSQNSNHFYDLNRFFQLQQWKGTLYIPRAADGYSQIHADAIYYESVRERLLGECALLVVSLLVGALLVWYLGMQKVLQHSLVVKGMAMLRRIPLDIRIVLLLPLGIFYLAMLFNANFFSFPIGIEHIFTLFALSLLTAYFMLHLLEAWRMYTNPESFRQQWQSSLVNRQKSLLKESFANKGVFFKVTLVLVLTTGLGMSLAIGILALERGAEEFLFLAFLYGLFYMLIVLPYILRRIGLMNRILLGASQMAAGHLDTTIKENPRGKLADLAHSLNNIKQGLKHSLEDQMKSERLKSELITNVSHDLKTPLTSIVNYVDLLKREDLSPEDIQNYVQVLERKTDRLKVLIDDLFEAAKMASGSVELNIEQVNVAALLNQAIAECSDKIEQSSLTFRVHIEPQKIYAPLDGKKTWRVFENLISNALKYSLPNTRVHVHLSEDGDKVVLTMKNVSAYEIDFDADELFERFKRADQSRNTEGSGLGLAIAKSIVELQGGTLSIEIDGDYFKVMVIFRR